MGRDTGRCPAVPRGARPVAVPERGHARLVVRYTEEGQEGNWDSPDLSGKGREARRDRVRLGLGYDGG